MGGVHCAGATAAIIPEEAAECLTTASVRLLEILVTAEDPDRFLISNPSLFQPVWVRNSRPNGVVDACLAALVRSLHKDSGCMATQYLHLSGLRTLGAISQLSTEQAKRII